MRPLVDVASPHLTGDLPQTRTTLLLSYQNNCWSLLEEWLSNTGCSFLYLFVVDCVQSSPVVRVSFRCAKGHRFCCGSWYGLFLRVMREWIFQPLDWIHIGFKSCVLYQQLAVIITLYRKYYRVKKNYFSGSASVAPDLHESHVNNSRILMGGSKNPPIKHIRRVIDQWFHLTC